LSILQAKIKKGKTVSLTVALKLPERWCLLQFIAGQCPKVGWEKYFVISGAFLFFPSSLLPPLPDLYCGIII